MTKSGHNQSIKCLFKDLTYNAQFNFCFPTIKAIPFRGYFERRFHAGYFISTWNQTFKEQCRYSRRVGDHTRLPAAVNPLSHQIPKFFSASSAERCFQRTPTKSRHKGRNRSGREPYLHSQNRQASVTKSSRFYLLTLSQRTSKPLLKSAL